VRTACELGRHRRLRRRRHLAVRAKESFTPWLTQVYESVQSPNSNGKLLWHALGAKTLELIKDAKTKNTHIIVERIVADIDDIVKKVRFPDWQRTNAGERLAQKELRRTLLKYKLHTDQELFDKAYG
jgi:hypothetical protein